MALHFADAARALIGRPLQNSAYAVRKADEESYIARWCEAPREAWEFSRGLLEAPPECVSGRLLWLLCNFEHPFGGVFTILRAIDALEHRGYENVIAVYDNPKFDIGGRIDVIRRYLPNIKKEMFVCLTGHADSLGSFDAAFATLWTSAYKLLNMKNAKRKAYFIQDHEALFYPAGAMSALCARTYEMPFHRLYNTAGLMQAVERDYPHHALARAAAFTPGVDARYFSPVKEFSLPLKTLVYTRPDTPRNAYPLCAELARLLHEAYGENVALYGAGTRGKWFKERSYIRPAGVVPYEKLPEFYAGFHIGISLMLTPHPSYIPLELMAAGAVVVSNKNPANGWLYQDGNNCCLADAAAVPLLEAFGRAKEYDSYHRLALAGQQTARKLSWKNALDDICRFVDGLVGNE